MKTDQLTFALAALAAIGAKAARIDRDQIYVDPLLIVDPDQEYKFNMHLDPNSLEV